MDVDFIVALKSTIDKRGYDLGQSLTPNLKFYDTDNVVGLNTLLESTDNALIWEFSRIEPTPDPHYQVEFSVGSRTVGDAANYTILRLAGKVQGFFEEGTRLEIKDYTGSVASAVKGVLYISHVTLMPQMYDKVSGIRLLSISGVAQRFV